MTKTQQIQVRQSEVRQKLNDLLGVDTRTDEQHTELETLTGEAQRLETEFRAAVAADPGFAAAPGTAGAPSLENETAEDRERREIRSRASLGAFVAAAITGRAVDGAEAEVAAAFGTPGAVPLAMFEGERRTREERAVTPAPDTADQTLDAIVPAIFQRSAAAWLGIDMPTVGTGDAGFPVLSTSVTGGPKAKSAASAETAGAFTVTTAQPRRITGAFRFNVEDAARLTGMEESLRGNLNGVLSDAVDGQAVNGSGTGDGTINGLLNRLTDPAAPAANAESFARYNAAMLSHIDGVFAVDRMGVRMLAGPHTYRHMAGAFRSAETDLSALDYVDDKYGGVRLSNRIADPAANIQQAVIRRTNPAGDRVAVMPTWDGVTMIRDDVTGAGKGEIVITAYVLVGDVILLRDGAFVQDSFRLA